MSEELKPCPFCGDTNLELSQYNCITAANGESVEVAPSFFIFCHNCGLSIEPVEAGITEADKRALISSWNTRAEDYDEA